MNNADDCLIRGGTGESVNIWGRDWGESVTVGKK